jgi:hypothetical protein
MGSAINGVRVIDFGLGAGYAQKICGVSDEKGDRFILGQSNSANK